MLVPGVDTDLLGVKRRECVGGPPAVVLSPRAERDSEEFRFSFSSCGPRMLGSCGVCGAEPAAFTDTDLHIIVIINIILILNAIQLTCSACWAISRVGGAKNLCK